MKTIISISLFIGITSSIFSQDYLPLPENNAKWVDTYSILIWDPMPHYVIIHSVQYCAPGIDTTINNVTYFVIDTCETGGYKGALRNDNGKVWYVPGGFQNEYLLYDFSAEEGETIFNVYYENFWGDYYLVDLNIYPGDVDSVMINGTFRKRIYVSGGFWIEGIGNTQGLLLEPFPNISDYKVDLYCMSANDTVLYPEVYPGECDLPVRIDENTTDPPEISVYPNPTSKWSTVDVSGLFDTDCSILLTDAFGKILLNRNMHIGYQNTIGIDISQYRPGVYVLRLNTGNHGRIFRKIIKK